MRRVLSYAKVLKKLTNYDDRFEEWVNRGKGGHREIYHPDINGSARSMSLPYHGKKTDIYRTYLKAVIRRFDLPDDFFD